MVEIESKNVQILFPIEELPEENKIRFLPPKYDEDRVFAAFPLIGSSQYFRLPFYFNSVKAFPDEKRKFLALLDLSEQSTN